MKLYLLKAVGQVGYGMFHGLVVRAETSEAVLLANESNQTFRVERLVEDGEPCVVLRKVCRDNQVKSVC